MTDQKILIKSVKKARENGYRKDLPIQFGDRNIDAEAIVTANHWCIIFSHDFAKAFWGEKMIWDPNSDYQEEIPIWKDEIVQLALAENRFKFLEQFLDKSDTE